MFKSITTITFILLFTGCSMLGVKTTRIAKSIATPAGAAQNDCEREKWLELAPSKSHAKWSVHSNRILQSYVIPGYGSKPDQRVEVIKKESIHSLRNGVGMAIYHLGEPHPLELPETLPLLDEPEVQRIHMERIQTLIDRRKTALSWLGWGLGLSVGGLLLFAGNGMGADDYDPDRDVLPGGNLTLLGLVGSLVGVGVMSAGLFYDPNIYQQTYFRIRSQLLVEGETDFNATVRGVNRWNQKVRKRCSMP